MEYGTRLRELGEGEFRMAKIFAAAAPDLAVAASRMADALRDAGLVHRDIRPENIWLGEDGKIRLRGFRFAVERKGYRKEIGMLRRHPEWLCALGGDFVFTPGRWNDVASLAACLEVLPRTPGVTAVMDELRAKAKTCEALCVKLPIRQRIGFAFKWLVLMAEDVWRPNSRSFRKHARWRSFCRNAAWGR